MPILGAYGWYRRLRSKAPSDLKLVDIRPSRLQLFLTMLEI